MNVPELTFRIELNGKDATKDLSPYILGYTYIDNLSGKADELRVELDNTDFRFLNDWFMSPGMKVRAWIGQMFCGNFMIDEPNESGPPDNAGFRAQSAEFSGPIRVKKSFSHYKKSLKDVVQKYADDNDLKLVGTIPDLNFTSIIQSKVSDIDFLHDLADTYGCICSVKGGTLVFDGVENAWKREAARKIYRRDVMSYNFVTSLPDATDGAAVVYNDIYEDEVTGAVVTDDTVPNNISNYTFLNHYQYKRDLPGGFSELDADYNVAVNQQILISKKVDSVEEANRMAVGCLEKKNKKKHTCHLTLPGDELLVSGNTVEILEFGKRSGFWLIEKSTHKGTRGSGNTTTIEISHGAGGTGSKVPQEQGYTPGINSGGIGTDKGFQDQTLQE